MNEKTHSTASEELNDIRRDALEEHRRSLEVGQCLARLENNSDWQKVKEWLEAQPGLITRAVGATRDKKHKAQLLRELEGIGVFWMLLDDVKARAEHGASEIDTILGEMEADRTQEDDHED